MQETRNNCFRSKICSTTLRQAKTGKHECRKYATMKQHVTATLLLHEKKKKMNIMFEIISTIKV